MNLLRVWLKLLRIPNHATVVADLLAGFLIVAQWHSAQWQALAWPPAALFWAIAAGLCLYAAGMVLNDLYDLALDRVERPERPLPRGQISPQAASAVGYSLLGAGVACGFFSSLCSGWAGPAGVACLLAAAVWLYDRHAKKTLFGPLVMGSCRSLNWLLGMTAAGGPTEAFQWLLPLGMGLYVAGITLYARDEAGRSRRGMLIAACVVMLLGCGLAGLGIQQMSQGGQGIDLREERLASWWLLWGFVVLSILWRAVLGIASPGSGRVQAAVGNAIMSLITLDAVLVLAGCGREWAIVVLLLLIPFFAGRRLVSAT